MKIVKIVVGAYGYKKDDSSPVELIGEGRNTNVCSVSDEEAARLIKLGVAVEAGTETTDLAKAEETATGDLDAESLEEYTVPKLKDLAKKLGFKTGGTKDELIKRISAAEVECPVEADTEDEEADTEEPPTFDATDPE